MTSSAPQPRPANDIHDPLVGWDWRYETHVGVDEHEAIAALLARSYGSTTDAFTTGRSWAGARPEVRVLGRRDSDVVAHAGLIRRLLWAPDHHESVLVGDVGLVAVDPERQGRRLGAALMETVAATLYSLGLNYGFLTCDSDVRPFYQPSGWTHLAEHPVRSIRVDHALEADRRNGMVLPVLATLAEWPSGPIERNGQEI